MRSNQSRADVILHPQRMAILRSLAGGGQTPKELSASLPELSQATLYRHLTTLLDAGVISVVSERKVRGTSERTYALPAAAILSGDDVAETSREDHFRYFATFLSGLLGEYGRYLDRPVVDLERDGVGYREHVLNVSSEELGTMLSELRGVMARYHDLPPAPGRSRRLLATVTLPIDSRSGEQRT